MSEDVYESECRCGALEGQLHATGCVELRNALILRAALLAELEAGVEDAVWSLDADWCDTHEVATVHRGAAVAAVLDLIRKEGTPVEVTLYETSVVKDPPHPSWTVQHIYPDRLDEKGAGAMTDTERPPTWWDRLRGYQHHDCETCRMAAAFPRLRVLHAPKGPRPVAPVPPLAAPLRCDFDCDACRDVDDGWQERGNPDDAAARLLAAGVPVAPSDPAAPLREALEGMVNQFAYWGGDGITTGGLSALEDAFDALGYSDPHPAPWRGCDEPGCRQEGSSGWPTPDGGYRHTCHEHSDWHVQRRCNYPHDDRHFAALTPAPKEADHE